MKTTTKTTLMAVISRNGRPIPSQTGAVCSCTQSPVACTASPVNGPNQPDSQTGWAQLRGLAT